MASISQILVSFLATLGAYALYKIANFFYFNWTSPLRELPGPPSSSIIYGNMKEIWHAENSVLHEKWVEEYGSTITYKSILGLPRLYTTDTKALNHILMNSYTYQKPESARFGLSRIVGPGVLVVEGEKHKQQRRIMNPAFGAVQIRELTEIFLRDIWAAESSKEGSNGKIEILSWLSRMTLDVIGLAGFSYKFNALTEDPKTNELNKAFSTIFRSGTRMSLIPIIRGMVPALRWLPADRDAEVKLASRTMERIGAELLRDSKAAVQKESLENGKAQSKDTWRRRDLLSLLLKANMATDLPPSQRMSDADVVAQVPTFLVAGHETTSTATTWALYALTQNLEAQKKLREELLAVDTENPTMDQLNALPYLDAVVRETLRVHAPVPSTMRMAVHDDVLPLGEPVRNKNGEMVDSIKVVKGQTFLIPILAMNRAKHIWGEDSFEFKPERWEKVPEAASSIPGIWGNMLTFLGGPHACIGYRFSLVETKALLFTLIRAFEFELAVPNDDIMKKSGLVQRPLLRSDPEAGNQMPLILKPVKAQ
ncbi:hypothetical protein D9619_012269 [Psilocybe cf. subviscida]|uniref:Cytochrome P450 n=1 Tax=Psilocybe cf. subviscida TaxID=2480587 RepID=A0A8H5B8B6_9AGAR|nr:hypothetical protein D9619_012269 [Psilocybe cf. subviscida]